MENKTVKNTKTNILKAVILTALLSSTVLADGDMGSGGRTCPAGQQTCLTGDMGSGGLTSYKVETHEGDTGSASEVQGYLDSVMESVYLYFGWSK